MPAVSSSTPSATADRTLSPIGVDQVPTSTFVDLLEQLHGAAREVGRNGTDAQLAAAAEILRQARRSLYLVLAEDPEPVRHPTP